MGAKRVVEKKSERDIQHECVEWFRSHIDGIIFSTANEAARTRFNVYEYSGAMRGAPDITVVVKGKVIFVEFKAKRGVVREEQKDFWQRCQSLGVPYHICRSLPEFQAIMTYEGATWK